MPQCCSPLALRSTAAPDRRSVKAPASPVPVPLSRLATTEMQLHTFAVLHTSAWQALYVWVTFAHTGRKEYQVSRSYLKGILSRREA